MPATPLKITDEMREQFGKIDEYRRTHPTGPVPTEVYLEQAQPLLPVEEGFLEVFTADQLHVLPQPEWLIEGIIEREGLSVLAGAPGSGKTLLAFDWALSLATGKTDWHGHTLPGKPTSVLYILTEGFGWIDQRVEAWALANDTEVPGETLGLVRENISIFTRDERGDWESQPQHDLFRIKQTLERLRPDLVVFDTYSRVTGGMDENSNTDVNHLLPVLTQWQQDYGVSILFLHHSTKDGRGKVRGAGALEGASDVVTTLEKKDETITLKWSKVKNAEEGKPLNMFLLKSGSAVVLRPEVGTVGHAGNDAKKKRFLERMDDPDFQTMTQKQQAEELGVAQGTISKWHQSTPSQTEEPDVL